MIQNLMIGIGTMALCLAVQCMAVAILLRVLLALDTKQRITPTLGCASGLLVTVMLFMLAGNLVQTTIWAGLFCMCGEFSSFHTAFYHSVVNFSTLGYGDVVMSENRRLLGALEAANGVLMFGLTTSVLFLVLSNLMQRAWDQRKVSVGKSK